MGSVYLSLNASFDPNTSFGGTWERFGTGKCLIGTDSNNTLLGEAVDPLLPNITGQLGVDVSDNIGDTEDNKKVYEGLVWGGNGALYKKQVNAPASGSVNAGRMQFSHDGAIFADTIVDGKAVVVSDRILLDASRSNSVYGTTENIVRPNSIGVIFWKRTA